MRGRTLGLLWALGAIVFVVLVFWGVNVWRSLVTRGAAAAAQRGQLTADIKSRQEDMIKQMRSTNVLQEMQFSVERADPSVFLTGLADITQGTRIRVLGITPLERQTTPQFVKSWQTVQLAAPFGDLRELAVRVEREKGILEDLVVEVTPPGSPGGGPTVAGAAPEIQAKFKLTSMEVTGEAKRILQRALAVTRATPGGPTPTPEPSLSLPFPPRPATSAAAAARDPFLFAQPALPPSAKPPVRTVTGPRPAPGPGPGRPFQITAPPIASSPVPVSAPSEGTPPRPLAPMEVKGIVGMPDGYLAIVNNEIVKAGDTIEHHRVERITATDVVLRQPDGTLRTLTLPSIVTRSPARR